MFEELIPTADGGLKPLVCEDDSIRGRLEHNKRQHTERLNTINQALAALDKNPELASLLELVNKAR
jgi:hypothetical protein